MTRDDVPVLRLAGVTPLAHGFEHHVFDHPDHADRIVKVVTYKPEQAASLALWPAARLQDLSRARARRAEMRLAARLSRSPRGLPPIPRHFGHVATDLGPGHVLERITLPGRPLGPTLRQIVDRGGLGPQRLDALNRFVRALGAFDIPARDLLPRNLVLGERGRGPEFVMVDGFGDKGLLHLHAWNGRLRQSRLDQSCQRMAELLGLHWQPTSRLFSKP